MEFHSISLLRSRLSGCHATLPRKERLLTFEHSFRGGVAWHPERRLRRRLPFNWLVTVPIRPGEICKKALKLVSRKFSGAFRVTYLFQYESVSRHDLCCCFNLYYLYNIWKDQLYRINGSEFYECLMAPKKLEWTCCQDWRLWRGGHGSEVLYSEPLIERIGMRQRVKEEFSVPRYSVWPPCDKSLQTAVLKALILGNFRTTVKR